MQTNLQQQIAFYLTGRRDGSLRSIDGSYRPALLAGYKDLVSLRYDMPLVLNRGGSPDEALVSLSELVDRALAVMADVPERDRIARHGYRIEREIRQEYAVNGSADFRAAWNAAVVRLAANEPLLDDSAKRLWGEFRVNGTIVDADAGMPNTVVLHLWNVVQAKKADVFRQRAERLLQKLKNILEAEFTDSISGRLPQRLRAGVGASFAGTFDFDAMSRILDDAKPGFGLSDDRRRRIQGLIGELEEQRFYTLETQGPEPYSFVFDRCSDALKAYGERHREAVELIKALAVAELETSGEYRGPVHDIIFDNFGANGLDARQLAQLPDYLVCVRANDLDPAELAQIVGLLAGGLPIKVLLRTDDVLQRPSVAEGHLALASSAHQLVHVAIGLTDVFVLQASASHLFQKRESLLRGLAYEGPGLFSLFSGASGHTGDIPEYLAAAAAMESRVFPAMVYDPSAGPDQASRMQVRDNPQPGNDWPEHEMAFEDTSLQARSQDAAFTLADFLVLDERFSEHFALVPKDDWTDEMITVAEALRTEAKSMPDQVPYITVVDKSGDLSRAIVDSPLLQETRRCLAMWNSLQELGGINNSHVERRLELERASQTPSPAPALPNGDVPVIDGPAPELPSVGVPVPEPAEADEHGDEAYIETARCTTCNECTNVNNRMFAYNGEKQAYIADTDAGTYRQLVEAAESCQVSIIHPGKPRNPNEPGLGDLIKRAAEFN